jgi:hypothetical protein
MTEDKEQKEAAAASRLLAFTAEYKIKSHTHLTQRSILSRVKLAVKERNGWKESWASFLHTNFMAPFISSSSRLSKSLKRD